MIIGLAKWLIDHIPSRFLEEPERFALALCFVVIGADAVFLGSPSSVLGKLPEAALLNLEVGLFMFAGGILKLIGLWRMKIWLQRLALSFLILGCIGLVVGIFLYGHISDVPVAGIYILFAVAYGLRLLSSTAERIRLYKRGEQCD